MTDLYDPIKGVPSTISSRLIEYYRGGIELSTNETK